MTDVLIKQRGPVGRITLNRPDALNAATYEMCLQIEAAFDRWREDTSVSAVVIDATGDRAFCAGGDIAQLYQRGRAGDFEYGRTFWADEYRLNAKIFNYPKPVVSFMQGYTMGGGVGLGCHGSHRIVGESSNIAMPECGIGLIPDVGGSLMLALAPGRLGEYLGTTGYRMTAANAIHAGFADMHIPQDRWPDIIATLEAGASPDTLAQYATDPGPSDLEAMQGTIDTFFGGDRLDDIMVLLKQDDSAFATETLKAFARNAPLSMAATVEVLHRLRGSSISMARALELEYRFTSRAMEHGDLLEGIRATIIDKDGTPNWQFADGHVPVIAVSKMLMPLGKNTSPRQACASWALIPPAPPLTAWKPSHPQPRPRAMPMWF